MTETGKDDESSSGMFERNNLVEYIHFPLI